MRNIGIIFCSLFSIFGLFARPNQPKNQVKKPNIVWIVCEDMSPHLGSYGEKVAKTPVLDQLAKEAVRYTQVYSTAGVCAPSRCALITGNYQTAIGGHNMRTLGISANAKDDYPEGLKPYSAVIPAGVKCFSEYLRMAGYYCTNNAKQDYQFEAPVTAWDESSKKAHWRKRPSKSQPFFSVFNIETTHESQVWAREKQPLLVDPKDVLVPPYYPDDSISRKTIARFLSNVMVMDQQVGEIIKQLKDDGLYEESIIFFYSDHGDGMPFVKRELSQRGLKVPLLIKSPHLPKGTVDDQLISFVDFAPTVLSLAGVPIPKNIQGQPFVGAQKSKTKRTYIYAARDRMDARYDRVRAVSDGRFKYIRNYMPEKSYYQDIKYRLQNPLMTHILALKDAGKLNEAQLSWFRPTKPLEELFDTQNDPHEFINLATNPSYKRKLVELRQKHVDWVKRYGDLGEMPELDMLKLWWKGEANPPKTDQTKVAIVAGKAQLSCPTPGASIGYRKNSKETWMVYTKPITINKGDSLYVMSHRIGYSPTEMRLKN
jgi:N-sulfoglucosamine sulfohydrolase